MWRVTADPDRFDEAVSWFRLRIPTLDSVLDSLTGWARRRAFTVAGVTQLDMVHAVWRVLEKTIAEGGSLDDFKRAARETLTQAWGGRDAYRIETVYRTNVQQAYNAGRWRQLQHPAIQRLRPWLMYDAVLDGRTSAICSAANGTVKLATDPYWESHHPPLHHRCRSALRALTPKQAERRGISTDDPGAVPAQGFGAVPMEDEWQPNAAKYPPELWQVYQQRSA